MRKPERDDGVERRRSTGHELLFPDGEDRAAESYERLRARGHADTRPRNRQRSAARPPAAKSWGRMDKGRKGKGPKGKGPKGKGPKDKGPKDDDRLDRECRKLLQELEKRCPGAIPSGPLGAGEVTDVIGVDQKDLGRLFDAALGVDERRRKKSVIWEQAGSELLVHLHRVRVAVLDGLILVGIPVETVETGRVEVTVAFGLGTPDRLAGMVATTEAKPRGPAPIVDLWGEALTAFAWQTLLDVVERLAARTGVDTDGSPLLPGALVADRGRLGLIPQAAHTFEAKRT